MELCVYETFHSKEPYEAENACETLKVIQSFQQKHLDSQKATFKDASKDSMYLGRTKEVRVKEDRVTTDLE